MRIILILLFVSSCSFLRSSGPKELNQIGSSQLGKAIFDLPYHKHQFPEDPPSSYVGAALAMSKTTELHRFSPRVLLHEIPMRANCVTGKREICAHHYFVSMAGPSEKGPYIIYDLGVVGHVERVDWKATDVRNQLVSYEFTVNAYPTWVRSQNSRLSDLSAVNTLHFSLKHGLMMGLKR